MSIKHYYMIRQQDRKVRILLSDTEPTQAPGDMYAVGPFRTKRAAFLMGMYGEGNPHMQTVADAEHIAKLDAAAELHEREMHRRGGK